MSNITRAKTEEEPIVTPQLYLRSLELVVNAIYSNPVFTIGWLDAHGQTTVFFEKFGRSLKKFSRVHDRKLGIIAFTSLLEQIAAGQCASLAGAASQILSMIIVLFNGLPKAISRRLQMEKEMNDDAESDSDEEVDDFDDDGAPGECALRFFLVPHTLSVEFVLTQGLSQWMTTKTTSQSNLISTLIWPRK